MYILEQFLIWYNSSKPLHHPFTNLALYSGQNKEEVS